MTRGTKHYFAAGNTADGYISLYERLYGALKQVFLLNGGSYKRRTELILQCSELFQDQYAIELYHDPLDPDQVEGLIVPELSLGIVNESAPKGPNGGESSLQGVSISLHEAYDQTLLADNKERITQLQQQVNRYRNEAYNIYAQALHIHDEWERMYIQHIDFAAASMVHEDVSRMVFRHSKLTEYKPLRNQDMTDVKRYFGAATAYGAFDYIDNITSDVKKRYFIKGRPGTGKSTMLRKLVSAAKDKGYFIEIYQCGLDPGSLDMLIIPELGVALFDSTAPHEYFPNRSADEIIDLYEQTTKLDVDKQYKEKLSRVAEQYKGQMKQAKLLLQQAKESRDELETIYEKAIEPEQFDRIKHHLIDPLFDIAAAQR